MEKSKFIMCFFLVVFLTTNFTYSQSKKSDNTLIKELISKKRSFNKEYSYGFRIQLYNGLETVARKTMKKFELISQKLKHILYTGSQNGKYKLDFTKLSLKLIEHY